MRPSNNLLFGKRPVCVVASAPVAQLDRASACGAGSRWFESSRAYHNLFYNTVNYLCVNRLKELFSINQRQNHPRNKHPNR